MQNINLKKKTGFRKFMRIPIMVGILIVAAGTFSIVGAVNCGDTIGPDQIVRLKGDLHCTNMEVALTVVGPAVLNLGGHTISGDNRSVAIGIQIQGSGAIVRNGTVTGFDDAVVVAGEGAHRIRKITAVRNNCSGFLVESDENRLFSNHSESNGFDGFEVLGNRNTLFLNEAVQNQDEGIEIGGNQNRIVWNTSRENLSDSIEIDGHENMVNANTVADDGSDGIKVDGDLNIVRKNRVTGNSACGIKMSGNKNRVAQNTIEGNSLGIRVRLEVAENILRRNNSKNNGEYDMSDDNEECQGNLWQYNEFDTSDKTCIQ